ncbi:hypothetical protein [Xenorhabdus entomophaga]|uniref:hypothetical protein n=1 Tax=Xenorhabdus entomophaga TaxID=3136257 RepID=UPI0030F44483
MYMYLSPRVLIFINQEAALGRNWLRGPNYGANDLFFSPKPNCNNPADEWPHLHLSYTYQDTLYYLGGKTSNSQRIDIFKNNHWNILAITQFTPQIQRAIIAVQVFWTPPPI